MILNLLAKLALSGTIAKRVKAAIAEAEAEGAKIVAELREEVSKAIVAAKAKL